MKRLEVHFTHQRSQQASGEIVVGGLAEDRGQVFFQYAPEFLKTGLNLSPFRLPFTPDLFEHTDHAFGPLPGLFDDSLPDGWGLLLMDRYLAGRGMALRELTPLDRLSWLGTRTMGALTYHPPAEARDRDSSVLVDLHELAAESQRVLAGEAADVLPQLLRLGGSPGGARPKVLVGVQDSKLMAGEDELPPGYEYWMIKFSAHVDDLDAGVVEYAYAQMAAAAGLIVPPTRLFSAKQSKDRYFGAQRFDRIGDRRIHMHTFGNLVQTNFRVPSCDYAQLLQVTSLLTHNHQDVLRAFRQMVFNILAHNRDDHVKNFAFLLDDQTRQWRLSPAYDLTWSAGPGGEHTMTVAGEGKAPGLSHIHKMAQDAGISKRDEKTILEQVQTAIGQWPTFAGNAGVTRKRMMQIQKTFPVLR